jgi:hypothetical protein
MTDDMTERLTSAVTFNGRSSYKRGWRKITRNDYEINIRKRLHRIIQDQRFPENVKDEAHRFLSTIVDDRMPSYEWEAARIFVRQNKIPNKDELKHIERVESAESHAVFLACQACYNLRDRTIKITFKQERAKMAMQLAEAINVLSTLQTQLLGVEDD